MVTIVRRSRAKEAQRIAERAALHASAWELERGTRGGVELPEEA